MTYLILKLSGFNRLEQKVRRDCNDDRRCTNNRKKHDSRGVDELFLPFCVFEETAVGFLGVGHGMRRAGRTVGTVSAATDERKFQGGGALIALVKEIVG